MENIEDVLSKKYGIIDIDKACLAIDYSNKTELVDKYGRTVVTTCSWKRLLQSAEETLMEEIP